VIGFTLVQLLEEMNKLEPSSDAEIFSSAAASMEASYVSLLLELDAARNLTELRIQPELLSFSLSGTSKLSPITKVVALENTLQAFEARQGIAARWKSKEEGFERGLEALSMHQLNNIQLKINALIQVRLAPHLSLCHSRSLLFGATHTWIMCCSCSAKFI
jgi:hypothetical protein